MKHTAKKIIAFVMVVAMVVTMAITFTACGGKDDAIMIGGTGPLTGDAASYGISVKNGAALAIKHLNEKDGMKYAFDMKDDQAGTESASTNYDILYDAGMQASIGGVTSASAEAFAVKANNDNVFAISPSASADAVIKDKKTSFRVCFGDPDQGKLAAEQIIADGYASVGAIYDSSDSYSSGIYEAFKAEMQAQGKTYIEQKFDAENKTDFSTQAEALKECDVVFMPFYYNEASLFIKASVAKASDAVFFGCDGFDGIAEYVTEVTNKIMYITPFDAEATDAKTKAFVDAYKAEYGVTPDQFAADAYDAVMIIADAVEKAGITDPSISASELCDAIIAVITAKDYSYAGLTGVMTWDASGACTKVPNIKEI